MAGTTSDVRKEPNFTLRRWIAGAAVAVLIIAGYLAMPSGRQAMDPGPTYDLTAASTLPDEYADSKGQVVGLTVLATPLNRFSAVWNQLFVGNPTVQAAGGVSGATYEQQALASRQAALNTAMSLYMGTDLAVVTVEESDVDDLHAGDRVLAINGHPAETAKAGTWLVAQGARPYEISEVNVSDPGAVQLSEASVGEYDGMHPMDPDSAPAFYGTAFPLKDDVGGPSMGLALAIAWLDALHTDVDLTDGKTIAATGTIDSDGKVGPVAGVKVKLKEAAKSDIDLVLIPDSYDGQIPRELNVKKVSTVKQAYSYLLTR